MAPARHPGYNRAHEMLACGVMPSEVSRILGIPLNTTQGWAHRAGIKNHGNDTCPRATAVLEFLREPGPWSDVRDRWIQSLKREGRR